MVTTEVKNVSYFQKLKSAFGGVLIGLLLLVGSIWGLFSNEGRVDLSTLAVDAVEVTSADELSNLNEKLVVVTGDVELNNVLEDDIVRLKNALILNKKMEAYAWVENSSTKTEKKVGGSEKQTTTYTYEKKWVTSVPDSSKFKEQAGHENVAVELNGQSIIADEFGLLGRTFKTADMRLPGGGDSVVNSLELKDSYYDIDGEYLYDGFGTVSDPEIGDVRISYTGLTDVGRGSVFGIWKTDLDDIVPFFGKRDAKLFGLYKGDKSTALAKMHSDYNTAKWGMRIGMLVLMFVAFSMILAPFHTVLEVIPFVASIGKSAVGLISFVLTLVIGGIVILLGKVWYSWILMLIVLALLGGYVFYRKQKA